MGGGAWDSLGRVGQRDCSVDDDDVKKPDRCSAPNFFANGAATSNPVSPGFIGRITTVRRRPDKVGSSIPTTRERAIVSSRR
jgi:hypothetical protein